MVSRKSSQWLAKNYFSLFFFLKKITLFSNFARVLARSGRESWENARKLAPNWGLFRPRTDRARSPSLRLGLTVWLPLSDRVGSWPPSKLRQLISEDSGDFFGGGFWEVVRGAITPISVWILLVGCGPALILIRYDGRFVVIVLICTNVGCASRCTPDLGENWR